MNEAARGTLQAAFDSLIQTPYWYFMLCSVERFAAITAQIGLSVIVWYAATGKKIKGHLFLAILLPAILDGVAVITAKSGMSLIIVEVLICLMAIGVALIARGVWKRKTL